MLSAHEKGGTVIERRFPERQRCCRCRKECSGEGDGDAVIAAFVANLDLEVETAVTHPEGEGDLALILFDMGDGADRFDDPPADFDTTEAFIVVTLDDACRRQQTGEGWFPDVSVVPARAITASVHQIMQCRSIISCVPFAVKADAVRKTLSESVSNRVPASILRHHPDVALFLDKASASLVDASLLAKFA